MAEFTRQVSDVTFFSGGSSSGGSASVSGSDAAIAEGISGLGDALRELGVKRAQKKEDEFLGHAFEDFYDALTGTDQPDPVITEAEQRANSIQNTISQTGDYTTGRLNALVEFRKYVASNPEKAKKLSDIFSIATGANPGELYRQVQNDEQREAEQLESYWSGFPDYNPEWSNQQKSSNAAKWTAAYSTYEADLGDYLLKREDKRTPSEDKRAAFEKLISSATPLALSDHHARLATAMDGYTRDEDPEVTRQRFSELESIEMSNNAQLNSMALKSDVAQSRITEIRSDLNVLVDEARKTLTGEKEFEWFQNQNKLTDELAKNSLDRQNPELPRVRALVSAMGGAEVLNGLDALQKSEFIAYVNRSIPSMKNIIEGKKPNSNPVDAAVQDSRGDKKVLHNKLNPVLSYMNGVFKSPDKIENPEELSTMLSQFDDGVANNYDQIPNDTKRAVIGFYSNPRFLLAPKEVVESSGANTIFERYKTDLVKDLTRKHTSKIGLLSAVGIGDRLDRYVGFKVNASGTGIEAFIKELPASGNQVSDIKFDRVRASINEINREHVPEFNRLIRAFAHRVQKNSDYKLAAQNLLTSGGFAGQVAGAAPSNPIKEQLMADPRIQQAIASGELTEQEIDEELAGATAAN
jgi:hypothetical protein